MGKKKCGARLVTMVEEGVPLMPGVVAPGSVSWAPQGVIVEPPRPISVGLHENLHVEGLEQSVAASSGTEQTETEQVQAQGKFRHRASSGTEQSSCGGHGPEQESGELLDDSLSRAGAEHGSEGTGADGGDERDLEQTGANLAATGKACGRSADVAGGLGVEASTIREVEASTIREAGLGGGRSAITNSSSAALASSLSAPPDASEPQPTRRLAADTGGSCSDDAHCPGGCWGQWAHRQCADDSATRDGHQDDVLDALDVDPVTELFQVLERTLGHEGMPKGQFFRQQCCNCREAYKTYDEQSTATLQEQFKLMNEEVRESGLRILLVGAAAVGKSHVASAAFGNTQFAHTGRMPITQSIQYHPPSKGCGVHLYDTKGFEALADNEATKNQLKALLAERLAAERAHDLDNPKRMTERIHAVWWVIDTAGGARCDPGFLEVIKELFSGEIPVYIVMNKSDVMKDVVDAAQQEIQKQCPWVQAVVPVVANTMNGPLRMVCAACGSDEIMVHVKRRFYSCDNCSSHRVPFQASYGIEDLLSLTAENIPSLVASAFIMSQTEWLRGLDVQANTAISASACGAMIATNLPCSCAISMGNELSLVAFLALNYHLGNTMSPFSGSIVSSSALAVALTSSVTCLLVHWFDTICPEVGFVVHFTVDLALSAGSSVVVGRFAKELVRSARGVALAAGMPVYIFKEKVNMSDQEELFVQRYSLNSSLHSIAN